MRHLRSHFFFLGVSLFVTWESLRLGLGTLKEPGPGLLPFCAGVTLGGLSLILIYRDWGLRMSPKTHSLKVILAILSLFAYSLALSTFGFIVPTFLVVGILFRLGQPRRWWALLGMSAVVTFLAYFVFGILLHVYFPKGFLGI